ncbi:MAG: DUF3142 domain-containing protein [Sphingomicrobium sp.]
MVALTVLLGACNPRVPGRVDARDHDSFWLWAGAAPPPGKAPRELYLLDGERLERGHGAYEVRRAGPPHLAGTALWLVVRSDTMEWPDRAVDALVGRADGWARAGNRVAGIQLDFDARTRHLDHYATFLAGVRTQLPRRYRLSITGLMDWSANGDPKALGALKGTVDEVVIQTYQGRSTIPGYDAYFARLKSFPIPFKVGLLEGGQWFEPDGLRANPNFRGYVVFLAARR